MEEERIFKSRGTYFKILELGIFVYFAKNATFVSESKSTSQYKYIFGFLFCSDNRRITGDG